MENLRGFDRALPAVDFYVAMEVAGHEALIRLAYKDSVGVLTWDVGRGHDERHRPYRRAIYRQARQPPALHEHLCLRIG